MVDIMCLQVVSAYANIEQFNTLKLLAMPGKEPIPLFNLDTYGRIKLHKRNSLDEATFELLTDEVLAMHPGLEDEMPACKERLLYELEAIFSGEAILTQRGDVIYDPNGSGLVGEIRNAMRVRDDISEARGISTKTLLDIEEATEGEYDLRREIEAALGYEFPPQSYHIKFFHFPPEAAEVLAVGDGEASKSRVIGLNRYSYETAPTTVTFNPFDRHLRAALNLLAKRIQDESELGGGEQGLIADRTLWELAAKDLIW